MSDNDSFAKKSRVNGLITLLFAALLITGAAMFAGCTAAPADNKSITIMQSDGTLVTLPHTAERIIILSSNAGEMLQILGASDKVVGASQSIIDNEYLGPLIPNAVSTGKWNVPDLETLITLSPDVVIAYSSSKPNNADAIKAANIPIVYIDCYKPTTMCQDVRELGKLVGNTEGAEEFCSYYENVMNTLSSRISNISSEHPRVFCEGYTDYSAQGKGSGMDLLLDIVDGVNIMEAEDTSSAAKVSPEWIIDQDPYVYIKVATHEKMGNAAGIYNDVVSRTGFSGLQSVKDGRFWLIDSGITYGPRCFAGAASFAKMLYPDEFKDLSVEEMLKDYNKRYSLNLPVEDTVYPKF
ncbi:MAG: ABC transporter substrate-binding protein [Methanomicrobium sp.]|nr:ABC transporter substrate-binding protein [Methanomicrobium sp.]